MSRQAWIIIGRLFLLRTLICYHLFQKRPINYVHLILGGPLIRGKKKSQKLAEAAL